MTKEKEAIVFDEFFEMGLDDRKSPFLTPQSRRWGVNLFLKASLLSLFLLLSSYLLALHPTLQPFASLALVGVYFLVGVPALIDSVDDLLNLELNIDVLMTLAAFSSILIGSPAEGAMLLVLFAISGAMADAVSEKAKSAISSLYKIAPTSATVILEDGSRAPRSVKDIQVGDKVLIRSGEVIPLDGVVVDGISSLNLVHLTGESLPIPKEVGDEVPSGAENLEGTLTIRVTKPQAESTVSRIIDLVTSAQEAKPKLQHWFEKFSKRYATTIIALSGFFILALPLFFGIPYTGEEGSIYRSVAFLIAASPCALIIATPIAYLSAISTSAKKGVLLKGGIIFDAIYKCGAVAFDKTGTLTTGELHFANVDFLQGETSVDTLLQAAAPLEEGAIHPIAKAFLSECEERKLAPLPMRGFKAHAGRGLSAEVESKGKWIPVKIGNRAFLEEELTPEQQTLLAEKSDEAKRAGQLIAVMKVGETLALFRFEDTLRPEAKEAVTQLKKQGLHVAMLTGDHRENGERVAKELGIDEPFSELKPEDKLRHVTELSSDKGLVMVGDGINDAPALTRANVGVAMGSGSATTATQAADVILLHNNLERLPWLFKKSKQTRHIIAQNLTLAASVILFATTPALLGIIPLWLAVVLHEGGTILVGLNALRLLRDPIF